MISARPCAFVAVILSLSAPSLARAQCTRGAAGCATGAPAAASTSSSSVQSAPSAAAAESTGNGAAEDGFTAAGTGTFWGGVPLFGGMLTAHFGVLRFLMVDIGFEHALSVDDSVEARETALTLGLRLLPNPRGRFRFVVPIRVGGMVRREDDQTLAINSRAVELTADAGLGLTIRLLGPLYLSAIGRAQARHTPGGDGVDWVGKADVGLTFLF